MALVRPQFRAYFVLPKIVNCILNSKFHRAKKKLFNFININTFYYQFYNLFIYIAAQHLFTIIHNWFLFCCNLSCWSMVVHFASKLIQQMFGFSFWKLAVFMFPCVYLLYIYVLHAIPFQKILSIYTW